MAVVGGGVGSAIAYPIAKKLHGLGAEVHSIVGFRGKDLVILEEDFDKVSIEDGDVIEILHFVGGGQF